MQKVTRTTLNSNSRQNSLFCPFLSSTLELNFSNFSKISKTTKTTKTNKTTRIISRLNSNLK